MTPYGFYNSITGPTQRLRNAFSHVLVHLGRARRSRTTIVVLIACVFILGLLLKGMGDVRATGEWT